ncbi:hypothetical protein H920_04649 [Fukomys damarensis]|uniref:Uncharacterized protein n=1 Tax=Fukomys damarensis TaxID=885580 RepID=A0A091DU35_FUKDA|nr:hypothetical protein H920_04649 [Fukomys damarensis]
MQAGQCLESTQHASRKRTHWLEIQTAHPFTHKYTAVWVFGDIISRGPSKTHEGQDLVPMTAVTYLEQPMAHHKDVPSFVKCGLQLKGPRQMDGEELSGGTGLQEKTQAHYGLPLSRRLRAWSQGLWGTEVSSEPLYSLSGLGVPLDREGASISPGDAEHLPLQTHRGVPRASLLETTVVKEQKETFQKGKAEASELITHVPSQRDRAHILDHADFDTNSNNYTLLVSDMLLNGLE